jgi:hypothetical protein
MKKSLLKKIVKVCGTPGYAFDVSIFNEPIEIQISRIKAYVACVNKVERANKK